MKEDDKMVRMRQGALARVRVSAQQRLILTEMLMDALRSAHKAGATVSELMLESGLSRRVVDRVLRGQAL